MTRFAAVGLGSFVLDTLLVLALSAGSVHLAVAVVVARIVSGSVNFALNRATVFADSTVPVRVAAVRYLALAVALLGANYVVLSALVGMGVSLLLAKLATEVTLFGVSYAAQRAAVFAVRTLARPHHPAPAQPARSRAVTRVG